jgi:hypothetical protein
MALVTNTGNAWDQNGVPIPAVNEPELWSRPLWTSTARGLLTDREVPAKTFNVATGAFTVELESAPGLLFMPILRWLKNPEDPKHRARGEAEWRPFFPGGGGPIDELPDTSVGLRGAYYGLGNPPPSFIERDDIAYIDISGVGGGSVQWWLPEGNFLEGSS